MTLKARVAKLEDLPETERGFYVERDGVFVLDVIASDGWALEDVAGLKHSVTATRNERDAAKKRLEAFGEITPEQAATALKTVESYGGMTPDEKVEQQRAQFEAQIRQQAEQQVGGLTKKYENEIEGLRNSNGTLQEQLSNSMISGNASSALSKLGGNVELLLPHVRKQTRMAQNEDGSFRVEVFNPDGNLMRFSPAPNSGTTPMTIDELVAEMAVNDTYASAFRASGASGSGGGKTGQPVGNISKKGVISRADYDAGNYSLEAIASGEQTIADD